MQVLTSVGVNLGVVQVRNDALNGVNRPIPVHLLAVMRQPRESLHYILKLPPTKNWRGMIAVL